MQESTGQGEAWVPAFVPTPPPPPRFDPRPTPSQQRLLLILGGAGLVFAALGYALEIGIAKSLQRGGVFLACYTLVVAASWLPPGVLSRRVDGFLDRWVKKGAGGYYGMMALATYAHLELSTLCQSIAGVQFDGEWLKDAAIQAATGFSIESVMNFIWAMAWPGTLFGKNGSGLAPIVLIGATWGVYELGRRFLPQTSLHRAS